MCSLSRRDGFFYALALWVFSYSSHILQALSVIQRSHTAPLSQGRFPTSSKPQKFSFKNWSYKLLSKVISHILQCYVVQVVPDDTMIPLYHLSVNPFLQIYLKNFIYFFTLKKTRLCRVSNCIFNYISCYGLRLFALYRDKHISLCLVSATKRQDALYLHFLLHTSILD